MEQQMTPDQEKALVLAAARLRLQKSKQDAPEFRTSFVPPEPSFLARVGRGTADVVQGVEQIGRRVFGDPESTAAWEAQKNAELQTYEQGAGPGFDAGRMLGNVAATAPLALIPGGASTGAVARTASGAASGVLGGASTYVDTSGGDFAGQKSIQATLGAVTGGVAGAAMPSIAKGVGKVGQKLRGLAARFQSTPDDILVEITRQAGARGIDLSKVPEAVKAGFVADALDQLDNTGVLDVDALARKANLERFGFTGNRAGTVGQITRDPMQWQTERNLMQLEDIGDPLRNRFVAQNQQLMQVADEIAGGISPEPNIQAAGMRARTVADKALRTSQETVSEAFKGAMSTPGIGDMVIDPRGMQEALVEPFTTFADKIPGPVRDRVAALVDGTKTPTVQQVYEAVQLVNRRLKGTSDLPEKTALQQVGRVLNQQLDDTAAAGGEAAASLRRASAMAAKRFGIIRGQGLSESKIVDFLSEGGRADNLVKRVMAGDLDDLTQLKRFFTQFDDGTFPKIPKAEMDQAWNDIRGGVLRVMNESANAGDPTEKLFSGFQWREAWGRLGPERQAVLYSPEERELIESAIDAATVLTKAPPFEMSNKSGTGGFLLNAMGNIASRMRSIPVLGQFADSIVGLADIGEKAAIKITKQKAAQVALNGKPYTEAQRRAFEAEALTLLNRLGQSPAAASGAVGVNSALNSGSQPANPNP